MVPVLAVLLLLAQARLVTVVVVAGDGPVPDARVSAAGAVEAATDAGGRASIELPAGAVEIAIEATGYLPIIVTVPADRGSISVALERLAEFEEEVIVTASRSPTRIRDQPLRVEVIDREEIEEKALMTPGSVAMLIGETTGLRVQATAPSLGAANVRIQGLRGRYSQVIADGLPLYGGQGDSFSLLQIPPLDLAQVEVIKGVASALYGAAALGGVVNLVSRRPVEPEREVLLNATSLGGADATLWLAGRPLDRWTWTLIGGAHGQVRRDRDRDAWTDVAGYQRVLARPRVFYDSGEGRTLTATAGVLVEDREGGTLAGGLAPDGRPFAESLATARGDLGALARWVTGSARLVSVRGSYTRQAQDRVFGDSRERGTRETGFSEVSLQGASGGQTWVLGGAYQHDGYAARDLPAFDYRYNVPAVFAQDELGFGPMRFSVSGRIDGHSEYGVLASPRASLLWRADAGWTVRASAGGGAFAPTPFVEDTDETGLSRLVALKGLEPERAWGTSVDVTRRVGGFELTGTLFASRVRNPIQMVARPDGLSELVNAGGPTRTHGGEILSRYRSGPFLAIATYALVRSRELDVESGRRRHVPLTPRHYATLVLMAEDERWGRAGLELYYVGRQALEENPYRDVGPGQVIVGALVEKRLGRLRVFVNAENLGDVRQTRRDPLVRPERHPDGRWTVDAWAPLDGRVVNAGVRVPF